MKSGKIYDRRVYDRRVYDRKSYTLAKLEKESGISQDELNMLLFFTVDVMNEEGLYIEANMPDLKVNEA